MVLSTTNGVNLGVTGTEEAPVITLTADLSTSDIPDLSTDKITSGVFGTVRGGTGVSTSTTPNKVFATATNGDADVAPGFRTLVTADLPDNIITSNKITDLNVTKGKLETTVQNSLDLADSALQSFEEQDPTVPSWAKEADKPTYDKTEVGLGNVDNTSDANKPISDATQTALNTKLGENFLNSYGKGMMLDLTIQPVEDTPNNLKITKRGFLVEDKIEHTYDVALESAGGLTLVMSGTEEAPTITISGANKVDTASIVNDLVTGGAAVPLSAEQGKVLDGKIVSFAQQGQDRGTVRNALSSQSNTFGVSEVNLQEGGVDYKVGDALFVPGDADEITAIIIVDTIDESGSILTTNIIQMGDYTLGET
jgi:hypothetical protein